MKSRSRLSLWPRERKAEIGETKCDVQQDNWDSKFEGDDLILTHKGTETGWRKSH
jgi:hypothetical protein